MKTTDFKGLSKGTHYILDEGDMYLDKYAAIFDAKRQAIWGLQSLVGKKVLFFSATLSNYKQRTLQALFTVDPKSAIYEIPAALRFTENNIEILSITGHRFIDQIAPYTACLKDISKRCGTKPCFLFDTVDNQDVRKELVAKLGEAAVHYIGDETAAMNQRYIHIVK